MHQSDTEADNINVDGPDWIKSIVITPLSPMSAVRFWYGDQSETYFDKEDVFSQTRAAVARTFTVDARNHIVDQPTISSVVGIKMPMKIEKCTVTVENGVLSRPLQDEYLKMNCGKSSQWRNTTTNDNFSANCFINTYLVSYRIRNVE